MGWHYRDTSTESVLNISGMPLCRWRSENTETFENCWWIELWNSFLPQFFRATIHWPECAPGARAGVNHCSSAAPCELRSSSFVPGDGLSGEASSSSVSLDGVCVCASEFLSETMNRTFTVEVLNCLFVAANKKVSQCQLEPPLSLALTHIT